MWYSHSAWIKLCMTCVWLEVVSVLHSHWMSCSGNALPHLFCEGSTNDCCEGQTWPGSLHDMKVRTTCCRIYTKGHLCESHSLSDSPVSMKKWVGEPYDWQENLFISSPLLQVGGGSDSFSHCPAWGWVSRPHCPHSRGRVGESVKWLHIFFTDNCDSASFLVQENLPGRLDLDQMSAGSISLVSPDDIYLQFQFWKTVRTSHCGFWTLYLASRHPWYLLFEGRLLDGWTLTRCQLTIS